ncbi:putative Epsin N-terminal domain-containing protein / clathrin assembly protein-related [Heracleum sosnowskyi]|uniref:Epsin N-terminal domain-containing protein / clathrin assembly protein-related n=1 Tax=Heracleum sosnowskyi TaxID=360622 RepID=A0AAD8MYU9_9APIA|nr:putative Epsin N-terminal domain-containing protein / clathrin assembly protein-related [Heracleum sosnowskyi]
MQRRIRQVLTSVREHTVVRYAKIATAGGFCDLDLIVVKATSPDDFPLHDKYVHQLLKIFSISSSSYHDFAISFTRRFGKTQCWRVALKCLVLLHRLLRQLPDDNEFRDHLLWTRSNGYLSLYPCHFRDFSSSASEDYTLFIRSYAFLLDEALECSYVGEELQFVDCKEMVLENKAVDRLDKMEEFDEMLEMLLQVQSLIDKVMECKPSGVASRNFVVQSAMKYIIRDSFICYSIFRRNIIVVLEHLTQVPYRNSITAFSIYKKAAIQANQLCEFFDWCKTLLLCGSYEFPLIEKIPQIQIQALETFLNGMWQLTDQSSSSTSDSSITSTLESPSSSIHDEQLMRPEFPASKDCKNVKEYITTIGNNKVEDMEPLIQFDDEYDQNPGWEALLESSINSSSCMASERTFFLPPDKYCHACGYGYATDVNQENGWQIQVYNPNVLNPFH